MLTSCRITCWLSNQKIYIFHHFLCQNIDVGSSQQVYHFKGWCSEDATIFFLLRSQDKRMLRAMRETMYPAVEIEGVLNKWIDAIGTDNRDHQGNTKTAYNTELSRLADFHIRKWKLNQAEIFKDIPVEDRQIISKKATFQRPRHWMPCRMQTVNSSLAPDIELTKEDI